jgi:hypothetical protein
MGKLSKVSPMAAVRGLIAVSAVATIIVMGAGMASADVYEPYGGSMASNTHCYPVIGERGIVAVTAMVPSTAYATGQWVTARVLVRRSGTTGAWQAGPWHANMVTRNSSPAVLEPSISTAALSPNYNVTWDVRVQGAWYRAGAWRYVTATAAQLMPTGSNTATPYWQHPTPSAISNSVNPYLSRTCLS